MFTKTPRAHNLLGHLGELIVGLGPMGDPLQVHKLVVQADRHVASYLLVLLRSAIDLDVFYIVKLQSVRGERWILTNSPLPYISPAQPLLCFNLFSVAGGLEDESHILGRSSLCGGLAFLELVQHSKLAVHCI